MDEILRGLLMNIPTIGLVVLIAISIYLLGRGADYLVDQAIVLSILWKIPETIIGATVVSLGTTIPEVTVSLMASLRGNTDLALGNAVGSIITNTSLILGLVAYLGGLSVDRKIMKGQGRILVLLALGLTVLALPAVTGGVISSGMGFLLLLILLIHIGSSIISSRGEGEASNYIESDAKASSILVQIAKLMLGVAVVVISSKILIPSVEITAQRVGIPNSVIAATLVAFGTSVPELITSVMAVRKGHGSLALGNIVGANILNILFVVGLSAAVSSQGLLVPAIYLRLQIPIMLLAVVSLYLLSMNKSGRMGRQSGSILLLIYLIYLILNYFLA